MTPPVSAGIPKRRAGNDKDFSDFFDRIQLAPEGQDSFGAIHRRMNEPAFAQGFADSTAAFTAPDGEFGDQIKAFAEAQSLLPEIWNLYVYIRLAENTLTAFRAKGIDDDIFYATLFDLTICCRVCQDRFGIYGISQNQYRGWMRKVLTTSHYRVIARRPVAASQ